MAGECKILVIEDEKEVSRVIKMMLELGGGYKVFTAYDGKEGIKIANMVKPNLILLDINMPEMNGMQTLEILKETSTTKAIPVVMLTGFDEDVFKQRASKLHDDDYIVKPIEATELVAMVEKVLARNQPK